MVIDNQKVFVIIQARINSTRLGAKVMLDLCGEPLINHVIERARRARTVDHVWIATSTDPLDDIIAQHCARQSVSCFRGSSQNVFDRFFQLIKYTSPDIVVRITSDNPFIEPGFIDDNVTDLIVGNKDYSHYNDIPIGSGSEAFRTSSFLRIPQECLSEDDKEHVTLFLRNNPGTFRVSHLVPPVKFKRPDIRLTVDTIDDYYRAYSIFSNLKVKDQTLERIIQFIDSRKLL